MFPLARKIETALLLVLAEIALVLACNAQQKPPVAAVRPVVDDYYGTAVTDNYRWMVDMKSPELAEWMRAQNACTLQSIPGRAQMLRDIQTYENARTTVDELEFYRRPLLLSETRRQRGQLQVARSASATTLLAGVKSHRKAVAAHILCEIARLGGTDWLSQTRPRRPKDLSAKES
jgi:hypothetical protein